MRKFVMGALMSAFLLSACASVPYQPPHYYLTQTARSLYDSTGRADSVTVHLEERLDEQLNATLVMGRRDTLEQAACGHVERHDAAGLWIDSLLQAWITGQKATTVVFSCPAGSVPIHWHVLYQWQGWEQCEPSPLDRSKAWAKYPAEMLVCGMGPDSVVAWRAKP